MTGPIMGMRRAASWCPTLHETWSRDQTLPCAQLSLRQAAVGTLFAVWPFIDQMNPSASVLALASVDVDLGSIPPGQAVTIAWRGRPVFIRRRTPEEIEAASAVSPDTLIDPLARTANLDERAPGTKTEPRGQSGSLLSASARISGAPEGFQGDYRGWLCHCHGSQYDLAARVRVGLAPQNLAVPPYTFLADTRVRIG